MGEKGMIVEFLQDALGMYSLPHDQWHAVATSIDSGASCWLLSLGRRDWPRPAHPHVCTRNDKTRL